MDSKWFGPCETCGKWRFHSKKRKVKIPVGGTATSQKRMCGPCFRAVETMLSINKPVSSHGKDNMGG